jgi:iron complex transport system substrate-binding protein
LHDQEELTKSVRVTEQQRPTHRTPDAFSAIGPVGRRRFLLGGVAGIAGIVLAACGGDDSGSEASSAPTTAPAGDTATTAAAPASSSSPDTTAVAATTADGPFTFTDDRGETISFDRRPERVVAWQAIVPALVELGITPVGVIAFNDLATNPAFIEAGVDVESLVAVSTSYGELDIEALATLQPDLILTYTFGGEFLQGFTDGATQELAGQIAPFVAMDANADVMTGIGRMEELAVLLGVDLESSDNVADAAAFDAAVADLQALIDSSPGLSVGFGGPAPTGLFFAPVESYPELQFYEELGLDVRGGSEDAVVSWELVGDVDVDVFLIDDRTTSAELDEAGAVATWHTIPAVAAGQFSPTWRFLLSYSRADYARTIQRMLPTLTAADPTIV